MTHLKFISQRIVSSFLIFLFISQISLNAVQITVGSTNSYNTSNPTDSQIPNWTTGWGASGVTGWDYLGMIKGPTTGSAVLQGSATYLGNGYVLTASHVSVLSPIFSLGGITYNFDTSFGTSGSVILSSSVSLAQGDVRLVKILPNTATLTLPNLPSLSISQFSDSFFNTASIVMTGYGGGRSWGYNSTSGVTVVNVGGKNTDVIKTTFGGSNQAHLVSGDSGGGDYVYDMSTNTWKLAGINVGYLGSDNYMANLSHYYQGLSSYISAVPEPGSFFTFLAALFLFLITFKKHLRTHVKI